MNRYDSDFWNALDKLANSTEIIIDRPKETAHLKYPDFTHRLDYGYLKGTLSTDRARIDVR